MAYKMGDMGRCRTFPWREFGVLLEELMPFNELRIKSADVLSKRCPNEFVSTKSGGENANFFFIRYSLKNKINAILKIRQGTEYIIKTNRFGKVHVAHQLIVTS